MAESSGVSRTAIMEKSILHQPSTTLICRWDICLSSNQARIILIIMISMSPMWDPQETTHQSAKTTASLVIIIEANNKIII